MEVGIRELRAHLSRWLKEVEDGSVITVTDRGKPIATIAPANGRTKLQQLIEAGIVKPAPRRYVKGSLPPPLEGVGPLSDFVLEDRR